MPGIISPEAWGVIGEHYAPGALSLWPSLRRDGQSVQRDLRELRAHFTWAANCDPLLLAALAELDEPTLRTAWKCPQAKAGQLGVPPKEFSVCDLAPGDVAVEPDPLAVAESAFRMVIRFGCSDRLERFHMAIC